LHSITLTLNAFAQYYYGKEDLSVTSLFTKWIDSYEYLKWKDLYNTTFPIGSITQYYLQLGILRIIPEWIDGILGDDKKHKSHIDGSPLLSYLGMGATYNGRDTLSLNLYFKPMSKTLNKLVELMVMFGKNVMDVKKIHKNLCDY
jgi:hypothetical protein